MEPAVVVARGPRLFLLRPGAERPVAFAARPSEEDGATSELAVPEGLVSALAAVPPDTPLRIVDPAVAPSLVEALERPVALATDSEAHRARARVPAEDPAEERTFVLAVGRARLRAALRAPEEVLVTLAREEERVERALGREERAAESFLAGPVPTLARYATLWEELRAHLTEHHDRLVATLEEAARAVAPNLSAVVGERVAARLIAAAGSLDTLARLRAPRLQLLGSRRRPSPERGPRFGVIYRAARMGDVPIDRRAAYARSLAALAAIAVRADATTHADLARLLTARRDRRIEQLRRRGR